MMYKIKINDKTTRVIMSVFESAKGLPQRMFKVSLEGTSKICVIKDAKAILKTIRAALVPLKPKSKFCVNKSIKITNKKFITITEGTTGKEVAKAIAPPRITPCISIYLSGIKFNLKTITPQSGKELPEIKSEKNPRKTGSNKKSDKKSFIICPNL